MNVLSDLGGTLNVIIAIIRIIMKPLIYQSFLLNAIMWLYNAKINDDYFFDRRSKKVCINFN